MTFVATTITHGPFTWVKEDASKREYKEEVWALKRITDHQTYFVLKNYGGKPNDESAFSGWRLVSGGPFTSAGGWDNLQDAVHEVTPFLIGYLNEQASRKLAEAKQVIKELEAFQLSVVSAA